MTMLAMGRRELELGGRYLGGLRDSTDMLADPERLRRRMAEDGYLLLRGLHRREMVVAARDHILANLHENGQIDRGHPLAEAVVAEGGRGAFLGGSKALTRSRPFLDLVESPEIMSFFARFLESDVLTFDYKWLRVVGPGDFTGAHYDVVYMGRGTHDLFTCWTPLVDVPYALGPLAILEGSHRIQSIRETYGKMDVDRDHVTGWFDNDPVALVNRFGGRWLTAEFQMGDVLLFGMFTMHGSLNNSSSRYRISCDTRYQRASDPVDERWIGEEPLAHYAWQKGETVPMEVMRKRWGV
jgi:ectoine hydroxylase-related dioxygenase (phytanoyl-CoA dioxygenase family)